MKTVAIIDDDVYIGDMLCTLLKGEGYDVVRAYSGTEALMLLSQSKPDLVLLDLMLPGLSGEELLPKIKSIPVIIVSAKLDIENKVELLMGGACDYITKPFDPKELLARVAVQLRSHSPAREGGIENELALDFAARGVSVCGTQVHLTRTEYAILKILMQNPNRVVSKSLILDRISRDTPDCRLHRKLVKGAYKQPPPKASQCGRTGIYRIGLGNRLPPFVNLYEILTFFLTLFFTVVLYNKAEREGSVYE